MAFIKDTGYIGVGLILGGIGGLFMNIGLGRLLSGSGYGTFRIFFSGILIAGWILAFGLEREVTSRLSAEEVPSSILGETMIASVLFGSLFVFCSILLSDPLSSLLGGESMVLPFVVGVLGFLFYRYTMGILKGFRSMKKVGVQNILLGWGKAGTVVGAFLLSWNSEDVSIFIAVVYLIVVSVTVVWLRQSLIRISLMLPSFETLRRVLLSTTKQLGDVIVKFGGPLIVPIVGGTSLDAGIFGGTLTLALIPFYLYNAVINNILPEVSSLNAAGDSEGIGRRVGFLLEISVVTLVLWTIFGTLGAPIFVPVIYQPIFELSTLGAFLIFFVSSAIIFGSLLTEVLIGISAETAVSRAWLSPLLILPVVWFLPWSAIVSTGIVLGIYISVVTILLLYSLYSSHVQIQSTGFDYTVFD